MAKVLPAALVLEKNKIATKSAWLILLEITLTDLTVLRFVRNTEDITFDSDLYSAMPFELDPIEDQLRGQIPTVNLKISNVTRLLQTYLEDLDGGIGSTVKIIVVNSDNLSASYSELELTFEVVGAYSDSSYAVFTLGMPNPLNKRFPLYRYIANHCNWTSRFKGVECGYAGASTTCTGTLTRCRELSNSARFGGFIGMDTGGVRFA
jgi:phage-related protein